MKRSRALVILVTLAACSSTPEGNGGDPDAGGTLDAPIGILPDAGGQRTFDPCVADPKPGYDPVTAGLTACCVGTGPAHCVPSNDIIPALVAQLDACDGDSVCMPDPIIRAGGEYVPPSCTSSILGQSLAGACLSKCIPLVADNPQSGLLLQDGCGEGELCVPCINPLNQQPTGACNLIELLCPAEDGGPGDGPPATCPHEGPPVIDPSTLAACSPACGGAHCVPAALVPDEQKGLLNACTPTGGGEGLCAPDPLIETGGNFVPPTCASLGGAEGRCLSTCLPDIAAQAALLPQDVCADGERCAPCFDPTQGNASTGACDLACDMPHQPPLEITCPWTGPPIVDPASFPACQPACGGSHCVPGDLVPADQRGLLAECPGGYCAPDPIIATLNNFVPASCRSVAGAEGRCLSICLPLVAEQAALLPRSTCAAEERCVPCFDPTSSNPEEPTGACSLGCDAPQEPPLELTCPWTGPPVIDPSQLPPCQPACAGSHCVPADVIPAGLQDLLAPCPGGFCTPDELIRSGGNFVPQFCGSIAGAEGRCLSRCLPDIASQPLLPQSSCPATHRCAPCYDPLSGDGTTPTGACSISCDFPHQPPLELTCPWLGPPVINPAILPSCAGGSCTNAHCLPGQYVPPDLQSQLAACPGGTGFCTPDPLIRTAGNYDPPTCAAFAGTLAEGRCLSSCLPAVSGQSSLEQSTCTAGNKCAPCFDPFTGADTGACSISSCDMPGPGPGYTFPNCCFSGAEVQGRCIPRSQIPDGDEDSLRLDVCPAGDTYLCVPNEMLPGGQGMGCTGETFLPPFFYDGTCLSDCLDLGIGEAYPQEECPSNHSCIPCFLAPDGSPGC